MGDRTGLFIWERERLGLPIRLEDERGVYDPRLCADFRGRGAIAPLTAFASLEDWPEDLWTPEGLADGDTSHQNVISEEIPELVADFYGRPVFGDFEPDVESVLAHCKSIEEITKERSDFLEDHDDEEIPDPEEILFDFEEDLVSRLFSLDENYTPTEISDEAREMVELGFMLEEMEEELAEATSEEFWFWQENSVSEAETLLAEYGKAGEDFEGLPTHEPVSWVTVFRRNDSLCHKFSVLWPSGRRGRVSFKGRDEIAVCGVSAELDFVPDLNSEDGSLTCRPRDTKRRPKTRRRRTTRKQRQSGRRSISLFSSG